MELDNKIAISATQGVLLTTEKIWDGGIAEDSEKLTVAFHLGTHELKVEVEGPFHGDPAPSAPAGELDGLWQYEVAELFLLGAEGHYLEIELSPHGHYLILHLSGIRKVIGTLQPTHCATRITDSRWQGYLTLPLDPSILPFTHVNAYAIHGRGTKRRYLSAFPVPGGSPDFHQPRYFGCLK